uniref:Uncharacterized protein n=1 Tax=viral metagenome TaxID=1070528 RepID=A0A6H1ZFZ4_9ZZZZ
MVYDPQSQFGLRIIEKYDQVQILESPVPWPWATVDLSIKYSDREESGWGRHVGSAKSLGLAQNAASLDEAKAELVGKIYELRQKDESYGEDQKTGQAFHGDVWRFMRVVGIGGQAPQTFQPQPQYVPPAANATPGVPPVAAASQQPPVAQAIPVVAQPIPTTSFNAALNPSDTAPVRAKKLLHTRALNEFLGVALVDSVIKADPAFVNSIYDQSFILGLKASGQAVLGQDGKFAIVS